MRIRAIFFIIIKILINFSLRKNRNERKTTNIKIFREREKKRDDYNLKLELFFGQKNKKAK